jgi:hypothetical protein
MLFTYNFLIGLRDRPKIVPRSTRWTCLLYTVGLLGRGISPSHGLYLHIEQDKHIIHAHSTDIHVRTHDPSVRASEDSSCLRPRGHCDRHVLLMHVWIATAKNKILSTLTSGPFRRKRLSINTRIPAFSLKTSVIQTECGEHLYSSLVIFFNLCRTALHCTALTQDNLHHFLFNGCLFTLWYILFNIVDLVMDATPENIYCIQS